MFYTQVTETFLICWRNSSSINVEFNLSALENPQQFYYPSDLTLVWRKSSCVGKVMLSDTSLAQNICCG